MHAPRKGKAQPIRAPEARALRRAAEPPADPGAALMERPGVLVRRLHQVHSAMFQEETAGFGVTPVQFSLMTLLTERPGLEQGAAAAGLRLDRFTTADVVRRLEAAGLLRTRPGQDRRAKALFLTRKGAQVFASMGEAVSRAHDRLVEPLPPARRGTFLRMLRQLVDQHGAVGAPSPKVR
ncbi:MarR family winged helix-turn-helix transcriptional regulator [Pararoseomonas indoligenes]|uniref:Winged helix-turn-helix transcriptional regulator n=1 Tax=Roseomonas indoligenes TaxID=2820811 RepID=A0A940MXL2_9PROT|nr:MarR family winged helix-turn-helix transcriptional regulator [Pararoseomonas indoligenes]MBP0496128.1 winged helix-turn-helix transcriptional regulator [Pararoseomonas indoligenes]